MKKLYVVYATLNIEMVVLAENEEQAKKVGKAEWHTEMSNAGLEADITHTMEIKKAKQVPFEELLGVPPYGEGNPQETLQELLDAAGIK